MKKLQIFSLITIFSIVFGLFSDANAQVSCPPPPPPDCEEQILTAFVTPPDFPNCQLQVTYTLRACGPETEIYDVQQAVGGSIGCEAFNTFLENLTELGLSTYLKRFNVSVGRQLIDIEATSVVLNSGNPLLFDCNETLRSVQIGYSNATCTSIWFGTSGGKKVSKQVPCVSSRCCKFSRSYCYDEATQMMTFKEQQIDESSGFCGGPKPPKPTFNPAGSPIKWFSQTPCVFTCGSLTGKKEIAAETGSIKHILSKFDDKTTWITVYPNPVTDLIQIRCEEAIVGNSYLFDLEGKLITQQPIEYGLSNIDVTEVQKGMYLLKIMKSDGQFVTEKIIIK